jgi:phosphate transport system substrate-binding protein
MLESRHSPPFLEGRAMRSRLSTALLTIALLATAVAGGGCGSPAGPSSGVSPGGGERFRISGSGTALPLLRLLTKAYPDTSVAFIYLPGLHSKGGIQGVVQRDLEIGAVSRNLTDAEKKLGVRETWLSNDGLVVAVHEGVGVSALTSEQVRGIYAGKYKNWREFGRKDPMPIVVLDRNEDESAKIILRKYVLGSEKTLSVTPRAIKLYYEPDMVEGLTSTPGAIGYFSLGYALSEHVPVTRVKLDGVEASVENIENGTYKVVRPLGIVTVPDPDPKIKDFLTWAAGPRAASIMREKGYSPARR